MENTKTNWFGFGGKTIKIEIQFYCLQELSTELESFKEDSKEFQRCILSTSINNKTDYADFLQEQVRYMDLLESKILQTGDRKLLSINNARMQAIGLVLSITAIIVSVYSILSGD